MGGYAPESFASLPTSYRLGGNAPESGSKNRLSRLKKLFFIRFWVDICRNGTEYSPFSSGLWHYSFRIFWVGMLRIIYCNNFISNNVITNAGEDWGCIHLRKFLKHGEIHIERVSRDLITWLKTQKSG